MNHYHGQNHQFPQAGSTSGYVQANPPSTTAMAIESPISASLTGLANNIAELEIAVQELHKRLQPVSIPSGPRDDAFNASTLAQSSAGSVADTIIGSSSRVRSALESIRLAIGSLSV